MKINMLCKMTLLLAVLLFAGGAHAQGTPATPEENEQGKAWTPAQYCASIPDQCEILDVECLPAAFEEEEVGTGYERQNVATLQRFFCMTKLCDQGQFHTIGGEIAGEKGPVLTYIMRPERRAVPLPNTYVPIQCPDIGTLGFEGKRGGLGR